MGGDLRVVQVIERVGKRISGEVIKGMVAPRINEESLFNGDCSRLVLVVTVIVAVALSIAASSVTTLPITVLPIIGARRRWVLLCEADAGAQEQTNKRYTGKNFPHDCDSSTSIRSSEFEVTATIACGCQETVQTM